MGYLDLCLKKTKQKVFFMGGGGGRGEDSYRPPLSCQYLLSTLFCKRKDIRGPRISKQMVQIAEILFYEQWAAVVPPYLLFGLSRQVWEQMSLP